MAKFQVGDKVRDRHTGAEGCVTVFDEGGVTVEWLDATRRLCIHTFNERRLLLVETAAAAAEGTRIERRVPKDDDEEPERELRITAPAPADGGVTVTVPEKVLEQLDERVEAERQQRVGDPVVVDVSGDEPIIVGADHDVDEEEQLVEDAMEVAADSEPPEDE